MNNEEYFDEAEVDALMKELFESDKDKTYRTIGRNGGSTGVWLSDDIRLMMKHKSALISENHKISEIIQDCKCDFYKNCSLVKELANSYQKLIAFINDHRFTIAIDKMIVGGIVICDLFSSSEDICNIPVTYIQDSREISVVYDKSKNLAIEKLDVIKLIDLYDDYHRYCTAQKDAKKLYTLYKRNLSIYESNKKEIRKLDADISLELLPSKVDAYKYNVYTCPSDMGYIFRQIKGDGGIKGVSL